MLGIGGSDWSLAGGSHWARVGHGLGVACWHGYSVQALDRLWWVGGLCPHTSYDSEGTPVNGKVCASADKNWERLSRVILPPSPSFPKLFQQYNLG